MKFVKVLEKNGVMPNSCGFALISNISTQYPALFGCISKTISPMMATANQINAIQPPARGHSLSPAFCGNAYEKAAQASVSKFDLHSKAL